jgi:hypothetical protein
MIIAKGDKDMMITEFRVVFKDLEIALEHLELKTNCGYPNVSLTQIDEYYAVNWDRKANR